MSEQTIHHIQNFDNLPAETVQAGPPYHCPTCGARALRIRCYTEFQSPRAVWKPMDQWGEYIWYLILPPACVDAGHYPTVARIDDAITPITPYLYDHALPHTSDAHEIHQREMDAIERLKAALGRLEAHLGDYSHVDPVAAIVYQVAGGAIEPAEAIERLHRVTPPEPKGRLFKSTERGDSQVPGRAPISASPVTTEGAGQ